MDIRHLKKEDMEKYEESQRLVDNYNLGMYGAWIKGNRAGMQQGEKKGIAKGITQGIAKGIAKGITQGIAKEKIAVANRLLTMGLTPEQVAEGAELPIEQVVALLHEASIAS